MLKNLMELNCGIIRTASSEIGITNQKETLDNQACTSPSSVSLATGMSRVL